MPPPVANTYSVGGSIAGLTAGGLVLANGSDTVSPASGAATFTFPTQLIGGTAYNVTVKTQPSGLTCTVASGSGSIAAVNVTNVAVSCKANIYSVGGTIAGLTAAGLVLANGTDTVSPAIGAASFTFPTQLTGGTAYNVTVKTQPSGQTCAVTSGSGSIAATNVTNVVVNCTSITYSVSGAIAGLTSGGLVLANGTDTVSPARGADSFTFPTQLASGAAYNVTVTTQPSGLTCTIASGSGSIAAVNVTNVAVSCTANTYSVAGTIAGLTTAGLVLANGADTVSPAGGAASFTFPTQLTGGTAYNVTVKTQPSGQTCTVASGSGIIAAINVTNVAVNCTTNTYSVGGTITGLTTGGLVLANGTDTVSPTSGAASFVFPTRLAGGAAYNVTVKTQPSGQTCIVANGSGSIAAANVTNVAVSCTSTTYSVGGTIAGLTTGGLVLANGTDTVSPTSGAASFVFPTRLAGGAAYNVTVKTQPSGQTCMIASGSGTIAAANVSNVAVSCATNTYSVGGTIAGLTAAGLVLANGTDTVSPASGAASFVFPTHLTGGTTYNVTVKTQPLGQACTVANGSGAIAAANVTNVMVSCAASSQWTWMSGSNAGGAVGVYGTRGTPAAANVPGSRWSASSWSDTAGNLWLFGGEGQDAGSSSNNYLNDLWKYDTSTGQWTWMGGSSTGNQIGIYGTLGGTATTNMPGGRYAASSWIDTSGKVWLFGGYGFSAALSSGYMADLWKYDPSTGKWTWMSGPNLGNQSGVYGTRAVAAPSNVPGSRSYAASWIDSFGNLWLFGGYGCDSTGTVTGLNDLWEYSPITGQWTWVSGSTTGASLGVYGTQGTAASTNAPGARQSAVSWIDSSGNLWLFGGYGLDSTSTYTNYLNDLWKFSPISGQWTWVGGSKTGGAGAVYGTQGTAASTNMPGARNSAVSWTDRNGNFWVFGGYGNDTTTSNGFLNDVWRFEPGTGQWTWMGGSNTLGANGVYGTQGTPAPSNQPGARAAASAWVDSFGTPWLFGGEGFDATPAGPGILNDLWKQ